MVTLRRGGRGSISLATFLIVGVVSGATRAEGVRTDCRALLPDGAVVTVQGWVENLPQDGSSVVLRARRAWVQGRALACRGPFRIRLPPRGTAPAPGTETIFAGRWWATPSRGKWPEPPERRGTLAARTQRPVPNGRVAPLLASRGRAQSRLRELFDERRSGFAEALLLAQRDGLDAEVSQIFAKSGLSHLLAISGTHVALVAAVLLAGARVARFSVHLGGWLSAVGTTAYVLLLGAPHAAARSLLQILMVMCARFLQRPSDTFTLMAAAALVLIAREPLALLDAGFQLSFAGVFGILAFQKKIVRVLPKHMPRVLKDSIAPSLAATLTTTPIAALHFGLVSFISLAANLIAIPAVSLAVPAIAVALGAGAVSHTLGQFIAAGASVSIDLLDRTARIAASLPGGHAYVDVTTVLVWLCACGALLVTLKHVRERLRSSKPGERTRSRATRIAGLAGIAAAILALVAIPLLGRSSANGNLEIHAIDVGQGDAIAIRSPRGRWILIDTGPRSATFDAGRSRVVPFLLRHGVKRIDALILTHPHADHVGGVEAVLGAVDVDAVLDPAVPAANEYYLIALQQAGVHHARWFAAHAGRELHIDDMTLRILAPLESALDAPQDPNDYSVVFRLAWGRFGALFLGDAPESVENELVAAHGAALNADVVKVGHHGSRTSTGDSLLAVVRPRVGLVSAGTRNRYGHPDPQVLQRLGKYGVVVLRTDRQGTLTVRVNAGGHIQLATERRTDAHER
jgi:competence protein ComEC